MQACKTHLVGTQKRKTHIIAGVLTILGCISGVYGATAVGNGGGTAGAPAASSSASEGIRPPSPRGVRTMSTVSMGASGAAGGDVGTQPGITSEHSQSSMHPALLKFREIYGAHETNPNLEALEQAIQSISIAPEDVKAAYERIKNDYYLPKTFSTFSIEKKEIKEAILSDIQNKNFKKALVGLYLYINRELLKEHLLNDPDIQKKVDEQTGIPGYKSLYEVGKLLGNAATDDYVAKIIRKAVGDFIDPKIREEAANQANIRKAIQAKIKEEAAIRAAATKQYEVFTVDGKSVGFVEIKPKTTVGGLVGLVRDLIRGNPSFKEMNDNLNKQDRYTLVITNGDKVIYGKHGYINENFDKCVSNLGLDDTQGLVVMVRLGIGSELFHANR